MKRIFLIIIIIIMLLSFSSCRSEFTFRGNHFGKQVKKAEGKEGEVSSFDSMEGYQVLYYTIEGYHAMLFM